MPAGPAGLYRVTQGDPRRLRDRLDAGAGGQALGRVAAVARPAPVPAGERRRRAPGSWPSSAAASSWCSPGSPTSRSGTRGASRSPPPHYWVAWITIGAIVAHLGAKWATTRRALRGRRNRPAIEDADPASAPRPRRPHDGLTRRGFLAAVAGGQRGVLTAVTIGQTWPALRRLAAARAPRSRASRPVNRSAANAGVIRPADLARLPLTVDGRVARPLTLHPADSLALPTPRGRAPHRPASRAGATPRVGAASGCATCWPWRAPPRDAAVRVESLERNRIYRYRLRRPLPGRRPPTRCSPPISTVQPSILDHGYPLRLIGPDRPGVTQTKWVTRWWTCELRPAAGTRPRPAEQRGALFWLSAAAGLGVHRLGECGEPCTTTSTPGRAEMARLLRRRRPAPRSGVRSRGAGRRHPGRTAVPGRWRAPVQAARSSLGARRCSPGRRCVTTRRCSTTPRRCHTTTRPTCLIVAVVWVVVLGSTAIARRIRRH